MLDDLKLIHERDAQDALGVAEKQWQQLTEPAIISGNRQFGEIRNVVYAGMGGSALGATFLRTWPTVAVPFELLRSYELPSYVGANTLVVASSYSGNTEETLSALAAAETAGAQIAVIAGGGVLQQIAEEKGYLFAKLPFAPQPRYAVFYNFRATLEVLAITGLLSVEQYSEELQHTADFLQEAVRAWRPDVPTAQNPAKRLALELMGKSIVVYAGPKMFPAAYKWKISFNENAKHIAWTDEIPEFNHNEFIGWSKQPADKPYAVIDLRCSMEHPRVQKRFVVIEKLLSGMRPAPFVVDAQGASMLDHLLWTTTYGDFVSLYLALLNGLNPAPVDLVERFKAELNA